MNNFCTISTVSHLYKVHALVESLNNQHRNFLLHVLVTDSNADLAFPNCKFWTLDALKNNATAVAIQTKYKRQADRLRWSLKPVLIKFLLEQETEKIIYIDNDQFFYSDYQFLFDLLDEQSILLTPHYYKQNPKKEQNWLEANFRVGLYNAGFIGVNKRSISTMQWWAECCEYRCEQNIFRGLFDDQKYLDLIPIIDQGTHIVRHKGCNLASWNSEVCQRTIENGELKISGEFAVVFIHFNAFTIREISEGKDPLLAPHYYTYVNALKKYKLNLHRNELVRSESRIDKFKFYVWKWITGSGL